MGEKIKGKINYMRMYYYYTFLFSGFDILRLLKLKPKDKNNIGSEGNKGIYESNYVREQLRAIEENPYFEKHAFVNCHVHTGGKPYTIPKEIVAEYEEKKKDILGSFKEDSAGFILPLVNLQMPHLEFFIKPKGDFYIQLSESDEKYHISLYFLLAIFESGRGLFRIQMEFEDDDFCKSLGILEIINIENVGIRAKSLNGAADEYSCARILNNKNEEQFLFDSFFKETFHLRSIFKKQCNNNQDIEWIEYDNSLVGENTTPSDSNTPWFQNPFVVTMLDLPEKTLNIRIETASEELNEISTVFIRLMAREKSFENLCPDFYEEFSDVSKGVIPNLSPIKDVFINMNTRTAIFITSENTQEKSKRFKKRCITVLLPSLLSTIETLRMRWHAYAVLNVFIEKKIKKLWRYDDFSELHDDISLIRENIAKNIMDPITYRMGGGALSELYKRGLDLFRIEELEELVLKKIDLFEKILNDVWKKRKDSELKKLFLSKS